jgi:hypothetical protein
MLNLLLHMLSVSQGNASTNSKSMVFDLLETIIIPWDMSCGGIKGGRDTLEWPLLPNCY